ncbi:uncharacterized protein TNCV_1214841 [Trichonephila clavipes]|nr:uncharacterized protein TNCV_1214841 [Trichonephila clavipes]
MQKIHHSLLPKFKECLITKLSFDFDISREIYDKFLLRQLRAFLYQGTCVLVPSRHGGTQNSLLAAIPVLKWVEGEERWEASDHSQGVRSQNWGGIYQNRTVTCMVLIAKANYRRNIPTLSHEEFRRP